MESKAGNLGGWASGEILDSVEIARKKAGETRSAYVVESVRQRLHREGMLPSQRGTMSPDDRALSKARTVIEVMSPEDAEVVFDRIIAERAQKEALIA